MVRLRGPDVRSFDAVFHLQPDEAGIYDRMGASAWVGVLRVARQSVGTFIRPLGLCSVLRIPPLLIFFGK